MRLTSEIEEAIYTNSAFPSGTIPALLWWRGFCARCLLEMRTEWESLDILMRDTVESSSRVQYNTRLNLSLLHDISQP